MTRFIATAAAAVILGTCGAALLAGAAPPGPQTAGAKTATSSVTPDELDRLLAPIALYPDALLGQMLLCASNPAKVGALSEWLRSHETLKGTELQDAAKASGFEDSFVAIVLFPDVVNTMAEQADWTRRVGQAFAADRSTVFASIQRLRTRARDAGTLKSTPQQDVETRATSGGQQVIVIEPANPQVVYVPQYNSQTVYAPATSSTVVVQEDNDAGEAVAAGVIGFTAGIALGAAMDNDYYYGPYGWHGGVYMYDDAWDDWYDAREDAREDWSEHREDIVEDRSERAGDAQEQRTERQETRQEARPETQAERTERQQARQEARPESQAAREQRRAEVQAAAPEAATTARATAESRGYSGERASAAGERSGTKSDAFSGYSSGRSERAASSRGQRSRSSSRGGGRRR